MQNRILVIGHSHIEALIAANHLDRQLVRFDVQFLRARDDRFQPWANWIDGELVINPVLNQAISDVIMHQQPSAIAVTVGGSQHFILGAFNHPRPFDFVMPGRDDLGGVTTKEVIPFSLMRDVFFHEQRNVLRLLAHIRAVADVPVFCLAVPPPLFAFIDDHMSAVRSKIDELGYSDPALRYKLWALCTDVVGSLCAGMDVCFLPPPAETTDDRGYLLDAFDADGLHGNAAYGAAVLRQIAGSLEASPP